MSDLSFLAAIFHELISVNAPHASTSSTITWLTALWHLHPK